jgi:hypothetical protein
MSPALTLLNKAIHAYSINAGGPSHRDNGIAQFASFGSTLTGGHKNFLPTVGSTLTGGRMNFPSTVGSTLTGGHKNFLPTIGSTLTGGHKNFLPTVGSTLTGGRMNYRNLWRPDQGSRGDLFFQGSSIAVTALGTLVPRDGMSILPARRPPVRTVMFGTPAGPDVPPRLPSRNNDSDAVPQPALSNPSGVEIRAGSTQAGGHRDSIILMTNSTPADVKYLSNSRANYLDWKRSFEAKLSHHSNKLLTVVEHDELAKSVEIKLRAQYKTLDMAWDATTKAEHLSELRTEAYHILLPTIGDIPTLQHIERSYGRSRDVCKAYKYINDRWAIATTDDERQVAKDRERSDLIHAGTPSASLVHVERFVEQLLSINDELQGTAFHWSDTIISTRVLEVIQVHDRAFVSGFKGARSHDASWKTDFAKLWGATLGLRAQLESMQGADDTDARRQSDVLATQAQAQSDSIATLTQMVKSLQTQLNNVTSDRSTTLTTERKTCEHCGILHKPMKQWGCVGMAVSTGKLSSTEAAKVFTGTYTGKLSPEDRVARAVQSYERHQAATTNGSNSAGTSQRTTFRPTRSIQMCVNTTRTPPAPPHDAFVLKFDTQAQDHIFANEHLFPDGVDRDVCLRLSTITPDGPGAAPSTAGQGTASMFTTEGIHLSISGAHLYPDATANVVATRRIEHVATIDFAAHGLRLKDGTLLPFDAGYCAMYIHPPHSYSYHTTTDRDASDTIVRHPAAAAAILHTGTRGVQSGFGDITSGPRSTAGIRPMSVPTLGTLYEHRTALSSKRLKALPSTTDAPARLAALPQAPVNDHHSMRANMPKLYAAPHSVSRRRTVCFDLQGPFPASKHGNNRYVVDFCIIEEEGSDLHKSIRRIVLDYMPTKDKFPEKLEAFLDTGDYKDYQFFTDNEYVLNSRRVISLLRSRKMRPLRNSCEYEPWQNPAERPWRTLSAASREFLLRGFGDPADHRDFDPHTYWPYTHQQAADVENAITDPNQQGRIAHLRAPFCLAYAKTPGRYRDGKLAPQAEACVHLGWSRTKPGYVLEVIEGPRAGRVITASQVKFRESVFPWRTRSTTKHDIIRLWDDVSCNDSTDSAASNSDSDDDDDVMPPLVSPDSDSDSDDDDDVMPPLVYPDSDSEDDDDDLLFHDSEPAPAASAPPQPRSTRSTSDVGDWRDVFTALDHGRREGRINVLTSSGTSIPPGLQTPVKPTAPSRFSHIANIPDPELRGKWYAAHYAENDGLFDKPDVLRAIPLPAGVAEKDLMHLHTIYTLKTDGRYKARTVLGCGKAAVEHLDLGYDRSFSPTARASTLRTCCALTAELDLVIRGGDATQAYGQADWPASIKKLLAGMPCGYNRYYDGQLYCCEVGNLYGHPVAGRNWYHTFRDRTLKRGYLQSAHDPCLFYKRRDNELFLLIIYVDDILTFTTRDSSLYTEWEEWFSAEFDWTNFGTALHEFTSVNIEQAPGSVTIDMERYIDTMKDEHFPSGIHHAYSAPADTDLARVVAKAKLARDTTHAATALAKRFRRLTMQLLYCAHQARPDILVAVNLLTRVQAYPTPDFMLRAERILIYLIGTKNLKITYERTGSVEPHMTWAPRVQLSGKCDATWDLAQSTSGYVFHLAKGPTSWATLIQKSIALSPMEAEIVAGSQAACEAVHLRGILEEAGHTQSKPTTLYMDCSSAIDLAKDPMHHASAKHIARRDLFIRSLHDNGTIEPKFIPTTRNTADALTKPLAGNAFRLHRATLLNLPA